MDEHLTRELFRAIHRGWRNPGDLAAIAMAHLFELCPHCRSEFERWRRELGEGVASDGHDYDAVFDRVRAATAANENQPAGSVDGTQSAQDEAKTRAEELLSLPAPDRLDWVRRETEAQSGLLLAEGLIDECRRRTLADPHAGLTLARMARVVLQHTPTSASATELYVRALAWLANELRVLGDFPRAGQVMGDARYLLRSQGVGDRLVRAELDRLRGSILINQGRCDDAIKVLLRALMTYKLDEAREYELMVLMKIAAAHHRLRDLERALELLASASSLVGPNTPARIQSMLCLNRALYLADQGRPMAAMEALETAEDLFSKDPYPRSLSGLEVAKFSILIELGDNERAEEVMLAVREDLHAMGFPYGAARIDLSLAKLYVSLNRKEAARRRLEKALPEFEWREIQDHAAEARTLLEQVSAR